MTDREMLELAAKAAELPEWGWMGGAITYVEDNRFVFWDPRDDDGDALRLAVALNMDIEVSREVGSVWAGNGDGQGLVEVESGGDWGDAARLAILRAAAEIGKAMP